jgi:hypothetical protein
MDEKIKIQGRFLSVIDIEYINVVIRENPEWSRRKISIHLCEQWDWRNDAGHIKDMACRSMLVKLDNRGLVHLPARRQQPVNRMLQKKIPFVPHDQSSVVSSLSDLRPLHITHPSPGSESDTLFSFLLSEYHYLGYKGVVGENIRYIITARNDRIVGLALFGAAAWQVAPRDAYLGWSSEQRQSNLKYITNQMRFCILPWVRVPYLASHILSRLSRRVSSDWQNRYGHPVYLIETFVDRSRFAGTCYKAANWIYLGKTKGRSRNGRLNTIEVPIKDIYVYPLASSFRREITQ